MVHSFFMLYLGLGGSLFVGLWLEIGAIHIGLELYWIIIWIAREERWCKKGSNGCDEKEEAATNARLGLRLALVHHQLESNFSRGR